MKKTNLIIKISEIENRLLKFNFPEIKNLDFDTIQFRLKQDLHQNDKVVLKKGDLLPFYVQIVKWGEKPDGVVFDFREINISDLTEKSFKVDFEYNILTNKIIFDRIEKKKENNNLAEIERKKLQPAKRVQSNVINLINWASKKHYFYPSKENIEDILKEIDYHLIISSPEVAKKFGITTLYDDYLPIQIILCIKKDMSSETIYIKETETII